jgi:hypothetical protein
MSLDAFGVRSLYRSSGANSVDWVGDWKAFGPVEEDLIEYVADDER